MWILIASNFKIPHHSEPTLFSLIRCESVFITMYPYRDAGQFSDASHRVFFYYVTVHGYTHIVMRVNFLMEVNGLLYYVTIHGCTHIVMWVNFLMQVTAFFSLHHCLWIYPYHDAGQIFYASQRFFVSF